MYCYQSANKPLLHSTLIMFACSFLKRLSQSLVHVLGVVHTFCLLRSTSCCMSPQKPVWLAFKAKFLVPKFALQRWNIYVLVLKILCVFSDFRNESFKKLPGGNFPRTPCTKTSRSASVAHPPFPYPPQKKLHSYGTWNRSNKIVSPQN